jgi:hypothetical protein
MPRVRRSKSAMRARVSSTASTSASLVNRRCGTSKCVGLTAPQWSATNNRTDHCQMSFRTFCHGRGRGFESRRPRHSFQRTCASFSETIEDPKGHVFVPFFVSLSPVLFSLCRFLHADDDRDVPFAFARKHQRQGVGKWCLGSSAADRPNRAACSDWTEITPETDFVVQGFDPEVQTRLA